MYLARSRPTVLTWFMDASWSGRGIELIAADSPHSFIEDTPTARLIRQVLGAVAEFDKAMTVAKLRGARDRKRATGVKVEGRKSHAELRPEVVSEAKRLYRRSPKTGERRSLREIAAGLASMGHLGSTGRPFSPSMARASERYGVCAWQLACQVG